MLGNQLGNDAISKMVNNTYDQEGSMINWQKLSNHNPISRRYSGVKNPRIARVSRDFGGKDRHSKVWTVKGLRDRRIRLSVPTAIDLYHLQDELGLTQPSKVIDWLIEVTKDDIDKLPPLQMALEDFNRFHLPSTCVPQDFHSTQLSFSPYFNSTNYDHQRTSGNEAIGENKPNTFNYHELYPSSNLSLSRPNHQLDTYASLLPPALAPPSEPQVSYFSGITPSFFSPYFMPNHFRLLSSKSPHGLTNSIPLNLMGSKMRLPSGLNMNTNVSAQRNDNE